MVVITVVTIYGQSALITINCGSAPCQPGIWHTGEESRGAGVMITSSHGPVWARADLLMAVIRQQILIKQIATLLRISIATPGAPLLAWGVRTPNKIKLVTGCLRVTLVSTEFIATRFCYSFAPNNIWKSTPMSLYLSIWGFERANPSAIIW